MNAAKAVIVVIVVLALAGIGFYLWQEREQPYLPPPAPARVEAPAAPQGPQPPKHPIEMVEEKPLPALAASDAAMREAMAPVLGAQALDRFFNIEDFVRRVVATVDNLPRESYAQRLSPVRPVGGLVATQGRDATLAIAPENARRYAAHVRLAEMVDAKKLAAVYRHFYPLFQQAYVELGYPNGHFNDRAVEVIDHLLATPEVKGPIRLVTPKVLHEYADPELESRSAGQKVLIRMGPENAAKVKAKLREIRAEIAKPAGG